MPVPLKAPLVEKSLGDVVGADGLGVLGVGDVVLLDAELQDVHVSSISIHSIDEAHLFLWLKPTPSPAPRAIARATRSPTSATKGQKDIPQILRFSCACDVCPSCTASPSECKAGRYASFSVSMCWTDSSPGDPIEFKVASYGEPYLWSCGGLRCVLPLLRRSEPGGGEAAAERELYGGTSLSGAAGVEYSVLIGLA